MNISLYRFRSYIVRCRGLAKVKVQVGEWLTWTMTTAMISRLLKKQKNNKMVDSENLIDITYSFSFRAQTAQFKVFHNSIKGSMKEFTTLNPKYIWKVEMGMICPWSVNYISNTPYRYKICPTKLLSGTIKKNVSSLYLTVIILKQAKLKQI